MDDDFSNWLANREDDTPAPMLRDGTTVGDFTVVGFLGRGGSGEVYRVEHKLLKTSAALKVLHRGDETSKARFAREAEILCKHPCPGFPRFFMYGETAGHPYLVTELLEERPLPTEEHDVALFMRQVAVAVGELHKLGLVHRDIKPSNILWRTEGTRSGASAEPVLIDLGLAKPVAEDLQPNLDTLSVDGGKPVGVGTPGYAAPEQFTGGNIGFSADIHALGVLANDCFGGNPPRNWGTIINVATSSIPGRRYRSVADLSAAIAIADGSAVLFRCVLATSAIPLVVCSIWMCIVLLSPLMSAGYQQSVCGSASFVQELTTVAVGVGVLSVIPAGLFKLKKWAKWLAMAVGAVLGLFLLFLPLADAEHGYGSFDSSAKLVLFFWVVPRCATFFLLLSAKVRSLFNR